MRAYPNSLDPTIIGCRVEQIVRHVGKLRGQWRVHYHQVTPEWGPADVYPDSLVAMDELALTSRIYMLEVEQTTRVPKQFLNKILKYSSYKQQQQSLYGYTDFILLVVCQGADRLQRYYQALHPLADRSWVWLTTAEAIVQSGAQDPIWKAADDGQSYALHNLAT